MKKKRMKSRTKRRIDTSEIPPLTEEFFQRAVRNPFFQRRKQARPD
jgi:hypothetical protein